MQKITKSRIVLVGLTGASLLSLAAFRLQQHDAAHAGWSTPAAASRISQLPAMILWAWERPEKLDFIDPEQIGDRIFGKDNLPAWQPRD